MTINHTSFAGTEFAQFAESQPDIWSRIQGAIISHASFGDGVIETVQQRKGNIPQLIIKFSSKSTTSTFNSDAFKTGKFTNVQIPDELLDLLNAWKKQMAIEKAPVAAEKATQKKTKKKKGARQNLKDLLRQIAIEDFGTTGLPASLMRKARLMASRLKITPKQALARVLAEDDQKATAKLKRDHKLALERVLRRKVVYTPKAKEVNGNPMGTFNAIEEAHRLETRRMTRSQLRREIEKMRRRSRIFPIDPSNNVRLRIFIKEGYSHPGFWPIRVRSTS